MSRDFTNGASRQALLSLCELQRVLGERNNGRRVRILVGKYADREAVIDGAIPDTIRKEWLFCCMVQRADGTGPLNSDTESRAYRPVDEFEALD